MSGPLSRRFTKGLLDGKCRMTSSVLNNIALPEVPYRGVEPFRYIDHPIFFARKTETLKLLRTITIYRGVLCYGDSGAGKSSLINAGLIPEAIQEGFAPDRIRLQARRGAEIIIERLSLNDDDLPPYLTPSLADGEGDSARVVFSWERFKEKLQRVTKDHYPLLIFDQFEEFITLFE